METPKKMTTPERQIRRLQKQVLCMKSIFLHSVSHDKIEIIRKGLLEGVIKQKEYVLTDYFYNKRIENYPLTEKSNWWRSDCNGYLSIIGGKLWINLSVYEERLHITDYVKFHATFILPIEFISEFKSSIEYAYEIYLQDAYEQHLEEEAKKWKKAFSQKLLRSTKTTK